MPAPPHRANKRSEGVEGGENGANRGLFLYCASVRGESLVLVRSS